MVVIHPNRAGQADILRSKETLSAVTALAGALADKVRSQGITVGDVDGGAAEYPLPVKVYVDEEDDEVRGAVVLAHPAGLAVQAKHGALTRAASELGLEVHG